MREQFDKKLEQQNEKFEKLQNEIKQEIKVEFQQVRGEIQEETSEAQPNEIVSEKLSEIEAPTKITKSKKRRIRKVRVLKFRGIKISKFRKLLIKQIRSTRVRKSCDNKVMKCQRHFPTKHRHVKPQNELTNNRRFRHPMFWTNPCQTETKRFQAIHHKVKSKKGNLFHKTYTYAETGGLGEQLCTKCYKSNENSNFQSDKFTEKLKNCTNCQMLQSSFQIRTKVTNRNNGDTSLNFQSEQLHEKCINSVKLNFQGEIPNKRLIKESILTEHKLRVGNSNNKSSNNQKLQQLFQKGIKLTKSSHKAKTNWPELDDSRVTNSKIPFKMKRKVARAKKINVKMKTNSRHHNFGKPKWKIKFRNSK
jgi:hypothetical protein